MLKVQSCITAMAESFTGYYSIPCSGLGRKILEFVGLSIPLLPISWRRLFDHNIRPDFRVFRIQRQPFLKPRFGISLDRVDWAFRLANTAIDAFVRVDDQHVLALVEAIHRAHLDAVHRFATNAVVVDDVGQSSLVRVFKRMQRVFGKTRLALCNCSWRIFYTLVENCFMASLPA